MERRPTRKRTTLVVSMLALTLIAPWAVGQDPDAIIETRRLAEQGDADAQYNLGYRYVTGIGVPQDRAEAVRWLRLAADQGHTQAEDFLGRMPPMGSQRVTDNVAETELPATLPPATGQSPRSGNPFRVPSLLTDAEQGDADSQFKLGVMYDNGLGVPENDAEAVRWFRLAAEQGNIEAQFILGRMYTNGDGVPQDTAEAARWHRLAAENGYVDAQTILGFRYSLGLGVPKDFAEAARWFQLAAEQRDAEAQYNLGVMYENGEGVPQDDAEAARWLRLAAEQGHPEAQLNLGVKYGTGAGVPEDAAEAVRWYRLAAEQGNAIAQNNLGVMYGTGAGVLKDSVPAHMWLNIASANGYEAARERRDNLERDMTRTEIRRATELARTCMASNYQDCEP